MAHSRRLPIGSHSNLQMRQIMDEIGRRTLLDYNQFDTLHFGCSLRTFFVFSRNSFGTARLVSVKICKFFAFLSKHFECEVKVHTHSMFWQIYIWTVENGSMCCNQQHFMWLWPVWQYPGQMSGSNDLHQVLSHNHRSKCQNGITSARKRHFFQCFTGIWFYQRHHSHGSTHSFASLS